MLGNREFNLKLVMKSFSLLRVGGTPYVTHPSSAEVRIPSTVWMQCTPSRSSQTAGRLKWWRPCCSQFYARSGASVRG